MRAAGPRIYPGLSHSAAHAVGTIATSATSPIEVPFMFKVNAIVLSICSAFVVVGCASLGELPDKVGYSLGRSETRHADMSTVQLYGLAKEYQAQGRYDFAVAAYL